MQEKANQRPKTHINIHYDGVLEGDPLCYLPHHEKDIGEVDLSTMSLYEFKVHVSKLCGVNCPNLYYVVPGKGLDNGPRHFRNRADMDRCTRYGVKSNTVIQMYVDHYENTQLNDVFAKQENYDSESEEYESVGQNCDTDSEEEYELPVYEYTDDDEDETASVDHLSEGEEEVMIARTISRPRVYNVADDDFLNELCGSYDNEHNYDDNERPFREHDDIVGDNLPVHNPNIKWHKMHPVIGEKYESPQQLKRALIFYAIANGYRLYFARNDSNRICVKCCKDATGEEACKFHLWASYMQSEVSFQIKTLVDEHTCSRAFGHGYLINCNWIASVYGKSIIRNPGIKLTEIQEKVLRKYKINVSANQCKRAKIKALNGLEISLQAHYAKLWAYANEIIRTNPGSSCRVKVKQISVGKSFFEGFYVCFKGLRDGWLEGCRRILGLDGCVLKTICKGQLLSAVGRDANNQIYPVAWAVVTVENKESWMWFMKLLIADLGMELGRGLTIISDHQKGLLQASQEVMPHAEHRQCARHIYANFRKKYSGMHYRNLFWKASKATYLAAFDDAMIEIKAINLEAHKFLMDKKPKTWSRAFQKTESVCDVENGMSECFHSVIVEARTKPIISMLEDIRKLLMDRMEELRTKHERWKRGPTPNIMNKFNFVNDRHRYVFKLYILFHAFIHVFKLFYAIINMQLLVFKNWGRRRD